MKTTRTQKTKPDKLSEGKKKFSKKKGKKKRVGKKKRFYRLMPKEGKDRAIVSRLSPV